MKENSIALVTESGNGLGKTFANILLEHNYKVILAASSESYKLLAEETDTVIGYELIEIDFSESSLSELQDKLELSFGKLDLLINNAETVNGFGQKIDQINIDDVKELYEINVFAVIRVIQVLKPLLEASKNPKIINITSSLGDLHKMKDEGFCYSSYYLMAYATSKAALNMFTHLQCKEFKPSKINIYSFDPVVMNNCTHNSVSIRDGIKDEFISLIKKGKDEF